MSDRTNNKQRCGQTKRHIQEKEEMEGDVDETTKQKRSKGRQVSNKSERKYQPTAEELAEIWQTCIFSFDANILLNTYCYTPKTRESFFEILRRLKDRIWLPHQVAYEYQKNRVYVIGEHIKAYERIDKILTKKDNLQI